MNSVALIRAGPPDNAYHNPNTANYVNIEEWGIFYAKVEDNRNECWSIALKLGILG